MLREVFLESFLTLRHIASKLSTEVAGNDGVQVHASVPIVRQTNYYMLPGDYIIIEELIEDVKGGIYVTGQGVTGSEVNPSVGTFTFSDGVS